jgi:hypothetical protein
MKDHRLGNRVRVGRQVACALMRRSNQSDAIRQCLACRSRFEMSGVNGPFQLEFTAVAGHRKMPSAYNGSLLPSRIPPPESPRFRTPRWNRSPAAVFEPASFDATLVESLRKNAYLHEHITMLDPNLERSLLADIETRQNEVLAGLDELNGRIEAVLRRESGHKNAEVVGTDAA